MKSHYHATKPLHERDVKLIGITTDKKHLKKITEIVARLNLSDPKVQNGPFRLRLHPYFGMNMDRPQESIKILEERLAEAERELARLQKEVDAIDGEVLKEAARLTTKYGTNYQTFYDPFSEVV
jgi:hypothetical protein